MQEAYGRDLRGVINEIPGILSEIPEIKELLKDYNLQTYAEIKLDLPFYHLYHHESRERVYDPDYALSYFRKDMEIEVDNSAFGIPVWRGKVTDFDDGKNNSDLHKRFGEIKVTVRGKLEPLDEATPPPFYDFIIEKKDGKCKFRLVLSDTRDIIEELEEAEEEEREEKPIGGLPVKPPEAPEIEKIKVETEKIKAETEKIKAHSELLGRIIEMRKIGYSKEEINIILGI